MATYKVLGQLQPAANTLSTLYTVPAANQAVASTLVMCNTGSIDATVRVAVRPLGASIDPKHYIVYNSTLPSFDSQFLTIGLALTGTDEVSVFASTANVSFNLFGSEI
jgi:hypothetical protein